MAHNGETGHMCPIACTAGAIKLIRALGTDDQKQRYLPRLLERDYAKRLHASQFLTEVQGGSDVGANACAAAPDAANGLYRITGEKWFCSVMDAGLFVVTARPEGAPAGTAGLGLFLVPRTINGCINNFAIRRLKQKLGTRSMATGETEFHGALAEPIGPLQDGFKNAVRLVLDTSRIHNAISACGILRRAFLEARTYAQYRRAFGQPIPHYPPVRRTLARIRTDGAAALASTFRILAMTDRIATGAALEHEPKARRIHVMINKYWTSLRCSDAVRMAIEVLGGNGTIEDFSVLPRLYRDTIVIESWEGTHNTLCLQVLRDFTQRGMHNAWIEDIRSAVRSIHSTTLSTERGHAETLLSAVERRIHRLVGAPAAEAQWLIRGVVDDMCVVHSFTAMLLLANDGIRTRDWTDLANYFLRCYGPAGERPDLDCMDLEARVSNA